MSGSTALDEIYKEMTCECCRDPKNDVIGVAAVPFIPMSIAWCRKCISAGAIPYWLAVANTAMCGGLQNVSDEWREIVDATLKYFGKTYRTFEAEVLKDMEEMTKDELEREERERRGDSSTEGEDRA